MTLCYIFNECLVLYIAQEDCEYDSVEVRSGPPPYSTLHGLYCGSAIPQPITSDGKSLRIEFTSDNSVQKTGFHAVFLTGKLDCL